MDRLQMLGHPWNHNWLYRVYRQLGLKPSSSDETPTAHTALVPLVCARGANEVWSADFMSDFLYHGSQFRTFKVICDFNRKVLAIEIDTSFRAEQIIRVLDRLKIERELPHLIRVNNGLEFLAQQFQEWEKANPGSITFSRVVQPRAPTLNGSITHTAPNLYLIRNLEELREFMGKWMRVYNEHLRHEALQGVPPCTDHKPTPENSAC